MKTVDYAIADNVKAFSTLRHEGFSSGTMLMNFAVTI